MAYDELNFQWPAIRLVRMVGKTFFVLFCLTLKIKFVLCFNDYVVFKFDASMGFNLNAATGTVNALNTIVAVVICLMYAFARMLPKMKQQFQFIRISKRRNANQLFA